MNIDGPAGVGASPLYTQLQICILDHEEGVEMCAPHDGHGSATVLSI